jgi:nucleoside-diphosphate-sugar epimerase
VKFEDRPDAKVFETNVEGTRNLLQAASRLSIPEFHLVSTAYVAGDRKTFSEMDRDCGQRLRNDYEVSKLLAERMVSGWPDGTHTIYRPSILVGGNTTADDCPRSGFYAVRTVFDLLRHSMARRFSAHPELERAGVLFDQRDVLQLPLHVECTVDSTLNLVPVDWAARQMAQLLLKPAANKTFHLVHPTPPRARWVLEQSLKIMEICGVRFDPVPPRREVALQRLQAYLDRNLKVFKPYLTQGDTRFCNRELVAALGDQYQPPPAIDAKLLAGLLDAARPAPLVS